MFLLPQALINVHASHLFSVSLASAARRGKQSGRRFLFSTLINI
jgi:hypothetical protein